MPEPVLPSLQGKATEEVVRAIRLLDDQIRRLRAQALVAETDLDRLNEAPPSLSLDSIQLALQLNGGNDLNVTGLLGVLAQPQIAGAPVVNVLPEPSSMLNGALVNLNGVLYYLNASTDPGRWIALSANAVILVGTHAQRVAAGSTFAPANYPEGSVFWETDRTALYIRGTSAGTAIWSLMMSRPLSVLLASRPADLGVNDAGFWIVVIDQGQVTQQWTGAAWVYQQGVLSLVFASRPVATTTAAGFRFRATDYGYQTWRSTGAAWVLEEGVGGPMRGTIIAADTRPAGLTANDNGFRFEATDAGITFRWVFGVGWSVQPNQILAGQLEMAVAQTISDATPTALVLGTTVLDQGPIVSGNTFVVPVNCGGAPSVWQLLAEVEWAAHGSGVCTVRILQNGTPIGVTTVASESGSDIVRQQTAAVAFNVAAGDVFSVEVEQNSGGNLDADVGVFTGYRMSPNG